MTLNLVQDRLWKGGACTKPASVPLGQITGTSTTCPSGTSRLGQVVLVPSCLYQTCPTGTRKGQKRPLLVPSLVRWDKSYTHAAGLSLSLDKLYTHDGACPSFTCPNLFHKVGLQGRERFTAIFNASFACLLWALQVPCSVASNWKERHGSTQQIYTNLDHILAHLLVSP